MIQRRAADAGIKTRLGNHTFRATGIAAYLKNKGTLEAAQHIANHESPRTTKLYDRRSDEISLDEVERFRFSLNGVVSYYSGHTFAGVLRPRIRKISGRKCEVG
jgi:integrase